MNNVNELKSALPNYNNCLVNLANSVLAGFGAQTSADTLKLADKYLAKGYKNVVAVTLGTGVGGGVIINEKIVAGSDGAGGEIGHINMKENV